ncbi:MAG: MATE family efflux transporter [Lachnospiraceae bacterium]|nr:MATE family efflux transporter [Candidatus Colinaster equi]
MTEDVNQNKMGVMPIGKLLMNISLPMMCSMLVQALYNIVDSIFVSKVCEDALTAVSLAFPMQSLMIAVGAGTGVGVNAMLSKSLGEKNEERVKKAATNGVFLSALSAILFAIIGNTLAKPFYLGQTDSEIILNYGVDYLSVICSCSFGIFGQFIFERLLQSTGKTVYTMITQSVGAIINLILDPIFIFGLFGVPRMEVKGAAIATVIGQIVAALLALILNIKKNDEVPLSFVKFVPDGKTIKRIYKVGVPSIIMQAIGSVMIYGLNKILGTFSSTAVAVFGVYFKLQSFILMPVFGLNNGVIPIVAYNYGAKKRKRMLDTMKLGFIVAMCIMVCGTLLFELIPEVLLGFFDASDEMLSMGVPALRIICLHFPIAAYCIIRMASFQALGNGVYSMVVSIMRQLVVLLPAAYLLSLTGNVNNVWWAFPIAETMSATISTICYNKIKKDIIMKIPE